MTIGIFIDDRYPISGGSTRSVELQVHSLEKLGHTVIVICPSASQDLPHVYRVPYYKLPFLPEGTLRSSHEQAVAITKRYKFDIVHSQTERGALMLAKRVAALSGAKHVHTFHGDYALLLPYYPISGRVLIILNDFYVRRLLKAPVVTVPKSLPDYYKPYEFLKKMNMRSLAMVASSVSRYITPMPYIRDGILKIAPATLGTVIPTGIDASIFNSVSRQRPADAPLRVVHVGRIVKEKRVVAAMEAFLIAAAQVPDLELTVIGGGAQLKTLQRLAANSPFASRIRLLGPINDRKALAQELTDADIFITASYRYETQGMVLLEGAAAGLALVYCDDRITVGVSTANAVLTGPEPDSMAQGLIRLGTNREETRLMGRSSVKIAAELSADKVELQNEAVYTSLI